MVFEKGKSYCSFSFDKLTGVDFSECCYYHDRDYRNETKKRNTREQADLNLKECIYNKFKSKNKKILGFIISNIYYYAVKLFCSPFWIEE